MCQALYYIQLLRHTNCPDETYNLVKRVNIKQTLMIRTITILIVICSSQ